MKKIICTAVLAASLFSENLLGSQLQSPALPIHESSHSLTHLLPAHWQSGEDTTRSIAITGSPAHLSEFTITLTDKDQRSEYKIHYNIINCAIVPLVQKVSTIDLYNISSLDDLYHIIAKCTKGTKLYVDNSKLTYASIMIFKSMYDRGLLTPNIVSCSLRDSDDNIVADSISCNFARRYLTWRGNANLEEIKKMLRIVGFSSNINIEHLQTLNCTKAIADAFQRKELGEILHFTSNPINKELLHFAKSNNIQLWRCPLVGTGFYIDYQKLTHADGAISLISLCDKDLSNPKAALEDLGEINQLKLHNWKTPANINSAINAFFPPHVIDEDLPYNIPHSIELRNSRLDKGTVSLAVNDDRIHIDHCPYMNTQVFVSSVYTETSDRIISLREENGEDSANYSKILKDLSDYAVQCDIVNPVKLDYVKSVLKAFQAHEKGVKLSVYFGGTDKDLINLALADKRISLHCSLACIAIQIDVQDGKLDLSCAKDANVSDLLRVIEYLSGTPMRITISNIENFENIDRIIEEIQKKPYNTSITELLVLHSLVNPETYDNIDDRRVTFRDCKPAQKLS